MPRRPKQRASLDGVTAKVERAKFYFGEFERQWAAVEESGTYRFVGQIHRDGIDHVFYPVDPPPPNPDWSLTLGDCIHNLRSALDHLAWQLVIANKGTPNEGTAFPIRQSTHRLNPCSGNREPWPLDVSGGIDPAALALIEQVQPYKRGDDGERLWAIHQLDAIDKHRHLVLAVVAIDYFTTTGFTDSPDRFPPIVDRWHNRSSGLVQGKAAARLTYATPQHKLDPNLAFAAGIAFGRRNGPLTGEPVRQVVGGKLIPFIELDLLPRFRSFVSP